MYEIEDYFLSEKNRNVHLKETISRLEWFGHVSRRNWEYLGTIALKIKQPGRKKMSVSEKKKCFLNVNMEMVGETSEEADDDDDPTGKRRSQEKKEKRNQDVKYINKPRVT